MMMYEETDDFRKKNGFIETSENLIRYRTENNFTGPK